jgi:hypothetical protein
VTGWSKSQWQRHISRLEAFEILKKGVIRREPEPNLRRGTLECRMEYYVAGCNLALVAAVDAADPSVIVVTVIDLDKE